MAGCTPLNQSDVTMTADFNALDPNNLPSEAGRSSAMNTMPRDRFELLSAYLDGEVSAADRKQVEEWLAHDPTVQRLHARLLKLRQGLQTMPIPSASQAVEQTVDQVFARVDRRPKRALLLGGAAIAAVFLGAIGSLILGNRTLAPQFAQAPPQTQIKPTQPDPAAEPLLVALDKPLVALPKTAVAAQTTSLQETRQP